MMLQRVPEPTRVARRARNSLRPLSEVSVLGLDLALKSSIALLILIASTGCGKDDSGTPLSTRLAAALEISEASRKDLNLKSIALDAVTEGNVDICRKCVEAISDSATGDDTAADCLRAFMKAKNIEAAIEMAKLIKNEDRRDNWLSDLSK